MILLKVTMIWQVIELLDLETWTWTILYFHLYSNPNVHTFFQYHTMTYYIIQLKCHVLNQETWHLSFITISSIWCALFLISSILRRPCHCFTETVVPCCTVVSINKTNEQPPAFTMVIIFSIYRITTSSLSYGINYLSWKTQISSGHNRVQGRCRVMFLCQFFCMLPAAWSCTCCLMLASHQCRHSPNLLQIWSRL